MHPVVSIRIENNIHPIFVRERVYYFGKKDTEYLEYNGVKKKKH